MPLENVCSYKLKTTHITKTKYLFIISSDYLFVNTGTKIGIYFYWEIETQWKSKRSENRNAV